MYIYNRNRSCCCNQSNTDKINQNNNSVENTCNNMISSDNNSISTKSGCGFNSNNVFPSNPMLGQSYVPIQYMNETFTPYCGLKYGTIFPELVTEYYPGQSMITNDYLKMSSMEV